jgi:hypothetical protein
MLFGLHLQSAYRIVESSKVNPLGDFADTERWEGLQRAMINLREDTLFGPVALNANQRNVGRGAASTQWLPELVNSPKQEEEGDANNDNALSFVLARILSIQQNTTYVNRLASPLLQAKANIVMGSTQEGFLCPPGKFENRTAWTETGSLLLNGCQPCPVDSHTIRPSNAQECLACPDESHTSRETGQTFCILQDANLIKLGALGFGYFAACVSWAMSLYFLYWIHKHRKHHIANIGQRGFLTLICIGTIISTSTVIVLSYQAGTDEDTHATSVGCSVAPFLYTIGWALQYSSLSAKTYRLYKAMEKNQDQDGNSEHKIITFQSMLACWWWSLLPCRSIRRLSLH